MRVRLIKRQTIVDYVIKNARSRSSFNAWLLVIRYADWNEPNHIVETFNSADILGKGSKRVVFNIGGNRYRMICSYHFGQNMVHLYVKWIGTHAEYSKLCEEGRQYEIDVY